MLANNSDAQILDLRPKRDIKRDGSPDLRSISKKPILV